jgi:hypothetical protein
LVIRLGNVVSISGQGCARFNERHGLMRRYFFAIAITVASMTVAAVPGAEPPPALERTFRARCSHVSHGRAVWIESAYAALGPALMQAHRHNEQNPGHDAVVLRIKGGRI